MAASNGSADGDHGFQIAPMVDVVFVLLLFFMAAAGFKASDKELLIAIPSAGRPAEASVIRIDITEEGVVSVNETALGAATSGELPELRSWLRNVRSVGASDPVVIYPAPGTRQERVIDVLNACAAEKVKGVKFG